MPYNWTTGDTITAAGLNAIKTNIVAAIDTWTSRTNITTSRWQLGATNVSGIIYAMGGATTSTTPGSASSVNEAYTISTNAWATKTSITAARYAHTVNNDGTNVYVIGGNNSSAVKQTTNYKYNVSANSWSTVAAVTAALDVAQGASSGTNIYYIGGYSTAPGAVATNYLYDSVANTWSTKASMGSGRYAGFAAVHSTYVYVFGGTTSNPGTAERYDTTANTWSNRANLPVRSDLAQGVTIGNTIYMQASSGYSGMTTVYRYDPTGDTYATGAASSVAHGYAGVAADSTYFYVISGWTGSAMTAVNERYQYVGPTNYTATRDSMVIAYSGATLTNNTNSVTGRAVYAKINDVISSSIDTDILVI